MTVNLNMPLLQLKLLILILQTLDQMLIDRIHYSLKSHDAVMPQPPPCSFALLSTSYLEIIQISSSLKTLRAYLSWNWWHKSLHC